LLQTFIDFFTGFIPPWLTCFFISALPILELRGGLITASLLGVPWVQATAACVLGNVLPIPFILLFVRKILSWMGKTKTFGKMASHYEQVALRKGQELVEKYPNRVMFGLFVFVAIPLPMTGAWTGSLIAAFLGLPPRRSFLSVSMGVLCAACIMLLLAYAFPSLMGFHV